MSIEETRIAVLEKTHEKDFKNINEKMTLMLESMKGFFEEQNKQMRANIEEQKECTVEIKSNLKKLSEIVDIKIEKQANKCNRMYDDDMKKVGNRMDHFEKSLTNIDKKVDRIGWKVGLIVGGIMAFLPYIINYFLD